MTFSAKCLAEWVEDVNKQAVQKRWSQCSTHWKWLWKKYTRVSKPKLPLIENEFAESVKAKEAKTVRYKSVMAVRAEAWSLECKWLDLACTLNHKVHVMNAEVRVKWLMTKKSVKPALGKKLWKKRRSLTQRSIKVHLTIRLMYFTVRLMNILVQNQAMLLLLFRSSHTNFTNVRERIFWLSKK